LPRKAASVHGTRPTVVSRKISILKVFYAVPLAGSIGVLEPIKVVKILRGHETGLPNFSQHNISNACAEAFNSAIQLKANARWFRNFTNYRARILFH